MIPSPPLVKCRPWSATKKLVLEISKPVWSSGLCEPLGRAFLDPCLSSWKLVIGLAGWVKMQRFSRRPSGGEFASSRESHHDDDNECQLISTCPPYLNQNRRPTLSQALHRFSVVDVMSHSHTYSTLFSSPSPCHWLSLLACLLVCWRVCHTSSDKFWWSGQHFCVV